MKTLILSLAFSILPTSMAFATDLLHGTVVSDFPSQIEVITASGAHEIFNYRPVANSPTEHQNLIDVYPRERGTLVVIAGPVTSKCKNNYLGKLVGDINVTYVWEEDEKQSLAIPSGIDVYSTCPEGSHDASDFSFYFPKN